MATLFDRSDVRPTPVVLRRRVWSSWWLILLLGWSGWVLAEPAFHVEHFVAIPQNNAVEIYARVQYFYNAERCCFSAASTRAWRRHPIVPGVMPIASFFKLARFSDACGAELPRWMRRKFESMGDDVDSIRAFGLDVVTEDCASACSRAALRACLLFHEPVGADARDM